MEAVNFITDWIKYMFIVIPIGAATAITYFAYCKATALDMSYKGECDVKIRQTIKGAIIGITVSGIIQIIKSFYL